MTHPAGQLPLRSVPLADFESALQAPTLTWLPKVLVLAETPAHMLRMAEVAGLLPVVALMAVLGLTDLEGGAFWGAAFVLWCGCAYALRALVRALLNRRAKKRIRCGWSLDRTASTLQPVGLPGQAAIAIVPQDPRLGCHPVDWGKACVLELLHSHQGPVAALSYVVVDTTDAQQLAAINRCADLLAQRLQIPRVGPPL